MCTQIFVQLDWFFTLNNIVHFGMLKMAVLFVELNYICNGNKCWIGPRFYFGSYRFSIGVWMIGCYLMIRGAAHLFVFVGVALILVSGTVMCRFCSLTFWVYRLVPQDVIQPDIRQCRRQVLPVIVENRSPLLRRFRLIFAIIL